ncbi:DUF305 domain-containing protein [uncultured Pseudokineococcus sp.]|uniref:DUF305 domain-containing protein n=1 Tax=uncultured Pseudokineococcus sp. TaxID=1642928 RepID=UPI0026127251|nr:DUF305 domain-containing protein [uncultured Pseudokineococcus sp.]
MPAPSTGRRVTASRALARAAASGLVVLAAVGTSSCSGSEDAAPPEAYAPPTAEASVPVLQPGLPGEPARTLAPEDAAPPTDGARWSPADAEFLQQMVTHHRQAVEMSALAAERAGDPDVAALAERIGLGQAPEVQVMTSWLEQRDQEVPPERSWLSGRGEVADGPDGGTDAHAGHGSGSGSMAGMATAVEVQQLADARGEAFDALFVDLMVRHHRGALAMVEEHAGAGVDLQVREMADEMTAVQTAEIAHLEGLRPA